MRRSCAALLRDLDMHVPVEPDQVIRALCGRMRQRLGKEVHHRLVPFPPVTVSGLWVETETAHYILCEKHTSPWHQLLITAHEFWHIEAGHEATTSEGEEDTRLLFPSLDPRTVARIAARRSHCSAIAEQEADFFASLLMAKVSRWLPERTWAVPDSAVPLVRRLETTLGHDPMVRSR